ncbi:hypothetical protein N7462_005120 [Penicillium macrosclerotiorum]|uniref:uncharacterized protein n=1 Tax=Penicillium macrosclerotiorum TaxID=303699 RepID=UPI002546C450|nr:uncharacterized protein N7462_005120 [Penicillium macrosclerotiorum]KAJ5690728.1 hypothetical protein N7462_005120 [Penicillium macrosclerotiorum]
MGVRCFSTSAFRAAGTFRISQATRQYGIRRSINPRTRDPAASNKELSKNYAPLFSRSFTVSGSQYDSPTIVRVPIMAESITEGTLTQFTKKAGEPIKQDEEIAIIETDKIDVSVNAPYAGVIQHLLVAEGDTVTVDQAIAELVPGGEQSGAEKIQESSEGRLSRSPNHFPEPYVEEYSHTTGPPPISQREVPISEVPAVPQPETQPRSSVVTSDTEMDSMISKPSRRENRVKMTRIRQKTAQHLKQSQENAAFLTTFNEVDMSKVIQLREGYKDRVQEKHGIKLGFMGIMAKASVLALKKIPAVNSSLGHGDTIIYRDYVDLSVAASIPKGLVTPVLRNIESMNIVEIERGMSQLVAKARDGKLTLDDLVGGSFTISNSGIWGSLFGTPIINMSQTAVLGTYGI